MINPYAPLIPIGWLPDPNDPTQLIPDPVTFEDADEPPVAQVRNTSRPARYLRLKQPTPTPEQVNAAGQSLSYHGAERPYTVQYFSTDRKGVRVAKFDVLGDTADIDLLTFAEAKARLRESGRAGRVVRLSTYLTDDGQPAVIEVMCVQEGEE